MCVCYLLSVVTHGLKVNILNISFLPDPLHLCFSLKPFKAHKNTHTHTPICQVATLSAMTAASDIYMHWGQDILLKRKGMRIKKSSQLWSKWGITQQPLPDLMSDAWTLMRQVADIVGIWTIKCANCGAKLFFFCTYLELRCSVQDQENGWLVQKQQVEVILFA